MYTTQFATKADLIADVEKDMWEALTLSPLTTKECDEIMKRVNDRWANWKLRPVKKVT